MGALSTRVPVLHIAEEVNRIYAEAVKYEKGKGVEKDLIKAAQLYKQAADEGHDKAQTRYGYVCLNGEGVPQSNREAFKYFKKAAINYDWEGKTAVGICYYEGIGTFKSGFDAGFHLKRCANEQIPKAQYYYAKVLHDGFGCSPEIPLAIAYLSSAQINGYSTAESLLKEYLAETTVETLRQEYVSLAPHKRFLAPALLLAMAELGDIPSMYLFAITIFKGNGFPPNHKLAFKYSSKAAGLGHMPSHHLLGYLYHNGYGCDRDQVKSLEHYKTASDGGYPNSHFNVSLHYIEESKYTEAVQYLQRSIECQSPQGYYFMSKLYQEGKGVEQDESKYEELLEKSANLGFFKAIHEFAIYCFEKQKFDKAIQYFFNAARHGDVIAYRYIAKIYQKGISIEKNEAGAIEWYKLGAMQSEDVECFYCLGKCYQKGIGAEQNNEEAIRYYKKAAEKNHEKAKQKLNELENNNEN
ncbi:cobalamin biosynthesis protein CobT [Histomonas meleagridis]|uniref:cobalamin biosynthesis protein CobT n=1 Tax=Histomonas meleagridis TaxID=135588 RepID=UPI00355A064B|nr:cobalamin biosynthesis protein CobT [Histomonas meleagridis]KAH0799572.1 cobalamin biosynthesis protein CobT [Histomonas meleagridis]